MRAEKSAHYCCMTVSGGRFFESWRQNCGQVLLTLIYIVLSAADAKLSPQIKFQATANESKTTKTLRGELGFDDE